MDHPRLLHGGRERADLGYVADPAERARWLAAGENDRDADLRFARHLLLLSQDSILDHVLLGIHADDLEMRLRHLTRAAVRAAWLARSSPTYPELGDATRAVITSLGLFGHAALQAGGIHDAVLALEILDDVDPLDTSGLRRKLEGEDQPEPAIPFGR